MDKAGKTKLLEQIEHWNDKDEFSRCIQAIEVIPEAERDYPSDLQTEPGLQQFGRAGRQQRPWQGW